MWKIILSIIYFSGFAFNTCIGFMLCRGIELTFESNFGMSNRMFYLKQFLCSLLWPINFYIGDIFDHFSIKTDFTMYPLTILNKQPSKKQ